MYVMYAEEQNVESPPTIEALRFTIQQYVRMRGSSRSENYPIRLQQQQPAPANQQNQVPAVPPAAPIASQPPQQRATYRQQPQRVCFDCGDPSHFVKDCPLKDRARKLVQQQVNSCNTNSTAGWTSPSLPHGMDHDGGPHVYEGYHQRPKSSTTI